MHHNDVFPIYHLVRRFELSVTNKNVIEGRRTDRYEVYIERPQQGFETFHMLDKLWLVTNGHAPSVK
jgi:hypothetical protein